MTRSTLRHARYLLAALGSVAFALEWPISTN